MSRCHRPQPPPPRRITLQPPSPSSSLLVCVYGTLYVVILAWWSRVCTLGTNWSIKMRIFLFYSKIQEVLVKFMEKAVRYDGGLNQVQVQYLKEVANTNRIELQTVQEAMDVVGILEYGLAKVADLMIKYVITPFVNCARPVSFLDPKLLQC